MSAENPSSEPLKGRGAQSRPANRFLHVETVADLEHVEGDDEYLASLDHPATEYAPDTSQSIVSTNNSPDIPFNFSLNPYRGCLHGCSYCYARPSHEYLGLSAGIDFETKIFYKPTAADLFRRFLARPQWQPEWIALSGITDCYQPVERDLKITRQCLEVAAECRQPMGVVTKNALVTRDIDLLAELARYDAVHVALSITTLDPKLARRMEPRTSSPDARLRAIKQLTAAGIPAHVMIAPVIPGLNDSHVPAVLQAAREAGATSAGYVLLRLPHSVEEVFFGWVDRYYPDHRPRIETLLQSARDGQNYRAEFGTRMRGTGEFAKQIASTFEVFSRKLGFESRRQPLSAAAFRPPVVPGQQMHLF
jgi:DNA repair photolyase